MHRFFIPPDFIAPEDVVFPPAVARQIRVVLRMTTGDVVQVLDNAGEMFSVRLTAVTQNNVVGHIIERQPATGEPVTKLVLYQSFLKRDKFEWVLQKGTEIGVSRFVPMVTRRSLVKSTDMKANKMARWQKILAEAAEQSHRGRIPDLAAAVSFETMLTQLPDYDISLIARAGSAPQTLKEAIAQNRGGQSAALLIGPEGGFIEEEVIEAQQSGAAAVTLGPRILRTETAALVAAALLLHELEP